MIRVLLVVTLPLLLGGCVEAGLLAAGFTFGAAAYNFNTEALKVWDEHHQPVKP